MKLVLLDDDELIHLTWKMQAKKLGHELIVFKNKDDLYSGLNNLSKDISIYIDSELGSNLKGEDIAHDLYERGYLNLFLVTGHPASRFTHLKFLKGILGKEYPL